MKSPVHAEKDPDRPDLRPDFRHVKSWIFDLDNTLYRADNGIFAQIESRMTDYVTNLLKLPRDEARARQKDLYRQYGTTLNGLMREHECDAEDYLSFVHDIDLGNLGPDAGLSNAIAAFGDSPNIIWCTGPSKTADVEGILIEGVHGPGEQIALLM